MIYIGRKEWVFSLMFSAKLADDFNHKLVSFLPSDIISRFPLTCEQIDRYHACLDWDIMSGKFLPGKIFVKYAELINWPVFLKNGKPKEINYLMDVANKLEDNRDIFFDVRIKKLYYTTSFILVFPQYVDWKWCCKHLKLDELVILKYWHKFNSSQISKYQTITDTIYKEKKNDINWKIAPRNKLPEYILREMRDMLNWDLVCKKQNLNEKFLMDHMDYLNWSLVAKYQTLSMDFIAKFIRKLPTKVISKYQDLTAEFIRNFSHLLDFDMLATNKNFNTLDSIQIIKSTNGTWFVVDPPMLGKFNPINFASCELFMDTDTKNTTDLAVNKKLTSITDYFDNEEVSDTEELEKTETNYHYDDDYSSLYEL